MLYLEIPETLAIHAVGGVARVEASHRWLDREVDLEVDAVGEVLILADLYAVGIQQPYVNMQCGA